MGFLKQVVEGVKGRHLCRFGDQLSGAVVRKLVEVEMKGRLELTWLD